MTCKHFQQESHIFNKRAKYAIINQLINTSKSKETFTQRLIERENFLDSKIRYTISKSFRHET